MADEPDSRVLSAAERRQRMLQLQAAKFRQRSSSATMSPSVTHARPYAAPFAATRRRRPSPARSPSAFGASAMSTATAASVGTAQRRDEHDDDDVEELDSGAGMVVGDLGTSPPPNANSSRVPLGFASPESPAHDIASLLDERARTNNAQPEANTNSLAHDLQRRGIETSYQPPVRKTLLALHDNMTADEMRRFIMQPAPKGQVIQMQIMRDRSGRHKFFPHYRLVFKQALQFCLLARKRAKKRTTNYIVSLSEERASRKDDSFCGKLRSNYSGTHWTVHDTGLNPKKVTGTAQPRSELCAILYEANFLGVKGPRKMHVVLPAMVDEFEPLTIRPTSASETILERIKMRNLKNLVLLHNKAPQWNEETQSYVLNFQGRVTVPSIKNFQLIHPDNPDYIVLQFGKCGKDNFSMDFQYPLTPLQAFCMCLSSFDNKLGVE